MAYRWIWVNWKPAPDFTDYSIEWRDNHTTTWRRLETNENIHQNSGPRVDIDFNDTSADIRGIVQREGPIWLRVSGHIPGTTDKVTSDARTVPRSDPPVAIGHQNDHKVTFTLSQLGSSTLDGDIRDTARVAAPAWAGVMGTLRSCEEQCPSSATDHLVTVVVQDTCWVGRHAVACVEPPGSNIETQLRALQMIVAENPRDSSRMYVWTRIKGLSQTEISWKPGYYWRYVDSVILHEFGHTFGLRNMEGRGHMGIMTNDWDSTRIEPDDEALLKSIYATHKPNGDW